MSMIRGRRGFVVAVALVVASVVPVGIFPARGELRPGMVVAGEEPVVHVGRRLPPGAPLSAIKPPYPEECGLGPAAPFAGFCDVVPLRVEYPQTPHPGDDVYLHLELTWPGSGASENPSSNLEFWLWDNQQYINAKQPIPEFDGLNTTWTPAEATSEYTLLRAGTGARRPARMTIPEPRDGDYNILVMNFNSQMSPQPVGPCPVSGGPAGCYVITARLEVVHFEPPHEKFPPA